MIENIEFLEFMYYAAITERQRLVLQTSTGTVFGTPLPSEESALTPFEQRIVSNWNEFRTNEPFDDAPMHRVPLRNVTIQDGNSTINIPFLVVFADHVNAVSLASYVD